MRLIYTGADRVIVWLGQSVHDAAIALHDHLVQVHENPPVMNGYRVRCYTSLGSSRMYFGGRTGLELVLARTMES